MSRAFFRSVITSISNCPYRWIMVWFLFCFGHLYAQPLPGDIKPSDQNPYPEGIYQTMEDLLSAKPSANIRLEMRDLSKPKVRIRGEDILQCYFYDSRRDKRVKEAFAISFGGQLFLHVDDIHRHMNKKQRRHKMEFKDSFLRILHFGNYLYTEGYFRKKGGIGIGVGIGAGPVGVSTGGQPKVERTPLVFNRYTGEFHLFQRCGDMENFLRAYQPERTFNCAGKDLPLALARSVMFRL